MAEVAVKPFIMKNAELTLGTPGDDFAGAVSSAELAPSAGTAEFKGLKVGAVFTFPTATTWVLNLDYAQDWSVENSLGAYLFAHQGETLPFTLDPDSLGDGHTQWTGEVVIAPGSIGGPVDAVATSTVTLGIIGAPVPTYVAPTP